MPRPTQLESAAMPGKTQTLRAAASASAIAGILLAGCGSSGDSSSSASTPSLPAQNQPQSGAPSQIVQNVRAKGPADIDANLKLLIAAHVPYMKDFQSHCAARPRYPFNCKFTATDTRNGESKDVKGTITVTGVYRPTRTYAFELSF